MDLAVWTVTRILSDNRILPGGYSIVDYDVPVPADVVGHLTVEAVLKYWPFPQKIVDVLLGAGAMKVEIVEMAHTAQRVNIAPRKELTLGANEAARKAVVPGEATIAQAHGSTGFQPVTKPEIRAVSPTDDRNRPAEH